MEEQRDPWLIAKLFDLSFNRFVALSLVRIFYVLLMIAGLVTLAFLVLYLFQMGQRDTTVVGVAVLLLSPAIYFVYLLVARLLCEVLIVLFAMAEDFEDIRRMLQRREAGEP